MIFIELNRFFILIVMEGRNVLNVREFKYFTYSKSNHINRLKNFGTSLNENLESTMKIDKLPRKILDYTLLLDEKI